MRRRKALARSVRKSVGKLIEKLESRVFLSATLAEGTGTATIQGVVYDDVNGNGVMDAGEPISAGVQVSLSEIGTTYPNGAPSVVTDTNGNFSFTSLAAGQYQIRIVGQNGLVQDNPGVVDVTVTAGAIATYDVGQTNSLNRGGSGGGSITGTLFNDVTQSGVYTPGTQQTLSGDTIYIDLNGSGTLTATDPQTTTNTSGQYTFPAGQASVQSLSIASNVTGGTFVLDISDASVSPAVLATPTAPITFDPASATNTAAAIQTAIDAVDPNGGVTVISPVTTDTISSAAEVLNTVTITTTAGTTYSPGQSVTIANVTPAGFDGTYTVLTGGAGTFTYADATAGLGIATLTGSETATLPASPFYYTISYNLTGAQSAITVDPATNLTLTPPTIADLTSASVQAGVISPPAPIALPAIQSLTFGPETNGGTFALDFADAQASPAIATSVTSAITFDPNNTANDNTNAIRNALNILDPNGGVTVTNGIDNFHYIITYTLDGPQALITPDPTTALTTAPSPLSIANVTTGSGAVPTGVFEVRVVPRTGFHQDPPGYAQVTVYSDQTITQNIGENNRSTISGIVYDDVNGNGKQDPGEAAVGGEYVFLDLAGDGILFNSAVNNEGTFNASTGTWIGGDPWTVTNAQGQYSFAGLAYGTYRVEIQSTVGMLMDSPQFVSAVLAQGQSLTANLAEGMPASISGTVFDDKNANGVQDPGEPGVQYQNAFLDVNSDGIQEGYSTTTSVPITAASEAGTTVTITAAGNYTVGESVMISGILPVGYTGSFVITTVNAAAGTFTYKDTGGLGVAMLDNATANAAVLANPPIASDGLPLWYPEPEATSGVNGGFSLSGLAPGTYTLRFITPPGGVDTAPKTPDHAYTFTLGSGTNLSGQNFGYQTPDLSLTMLHYPTRTVFGGTTLRATARVTNVGNYTAAGVAAVNLYAETTNTGLDTSTAIYIGSIGGRNIHLAPGQSRVFVLNFAYPTQTATGSYYIYALLVSNVHDNDPANNLLAPVGPVMIVEPVIDLQNTYVVQPADEVDPGQPTTVEVAVTNNGNVASVGELAFRVYITATPVVEPTDTVVQTTYFQNVRIRPGKTRIFDVTINTPGTELGSEYIILDADSGDTLGETNLLNNFAVPTSPTAFR